MPVEHGEAAGDIHDGLALLCAEGGLPCGPATLVETTPITSGWESEVYAFTVSPQTSNSISTYILRIYSGEGGESKAFRESSAMRNLFQAGYPVPEVHLTGPAPAPFGKPFMVMERIEGPSLGDAARGGNEAERERYATLFFETFVRLHRLDPSGVTPCPAEPAHGPYFPLLEEVNGVILYAMSVGLNTSSNCSTLLDWFHARRNAMECPHLSVIHYDYHPENVLIRLDGSPCVIDWTCVTAGDYRMDLALTLMMLNTYGEPSQRSQHLERYQRIAGAAAENMDLFEAFASLRRLLILWVALKRNPAELGMRAGAADLLRSQGDHLRHVYDWHTARTGIAWREIEDLIAVMS